jgi:hypothetical protein
MAQMRIQEMCKNFGLGNLLGKAQLKPEKKREAQYAWTIMEMAVTQLVEALRYNLEAGSSIPNAVVGILP